MIEKLTDIFSEELKLPKVLVRPQVAKLLDRLSAEGIHVVSPENGRIPPTFLRDPHVKIESGSHFCPHCGAHNPRLLIAPKLAELPPGTASFTLLWDFLVVACGECRTLLDIAGVGMRPKDTNAVGKVQG